MKSCAALLAFGCLLAAAPALAVQDRTLRGSIEPSGRASVSIAYVERKGLTYRRYTVGFRDIPLKCHDGATVTVDIDPTHQLIRNGSPGARGFVLGVGGASARFEYGWVYRGRLTAPREARGTVRYHSDSVQLPGGARDSCHSGRLRWSASG
jgi:hypothetical protein